MKVSTKGRYGLRALADMALQPAEALSTLPEIAGRQKISLNYLEQVFGTLRKAGLVKSIRGKNGGYYMAKPAEEITVQEVLEALEGKFAITDGVLPGADEDTVRSVIQSLVWDEIDGHVSDYLGSRTIGQLAEKYRAGTAVKTESEGHIYENRQETAL